MALIIESKYSLIFEFEPGNREEPNDTTFILNRTSFILKTNKIGLLINKVMELKTVSQGVFRKELNAKNMKRKPLR